MILTMEGVYRVRSVCSQYANGAIKLEQNLPQSQYLFIATKCAGKADASSTVLCLVLIV